jgi:hypothetical protein
VAETLWSEVSEHRAYAALRSALARLDRTSRQTLQVTASSLELTQGVAVDLRDALALAHRLLGPTPPAEADLSAAATASLSLDLLPFWYDDWALLEAEDIVKLTLIMIFFAEANTRYSGHVRRTGWHCVFASAKKIMIKVNLTMPGTTRVIDANVQWHDARPPHLHGLHAPSPPHRQYPRRGGRGDHHPSAWHQHPHPAPVIIRWSRTHHGAQPRLSQCFGTVIHTWPLR